MTATTQQSSASKALHLLPMDADGFLIDPALWNPQMARAIARLDDLELTPDHWPILYSLREHRLTYGSIPPISRICRAHGMERRAVHRLFGSCRQAWRIAGLSHPGEEALAYMS